MALRRPYRSGSPLTFCLIFVLSIAFLAPLYHSHDHADDYHQEHGDDHTVFHDVSVHEDLSTGESHNDSHLHIKNDIGRTDRHLRFNSKSLIPDLCTIASTPVSVGQRTGRRSKHSQQPIFRCSSYDCLSGLSPPTA